MDERYVSKWKPISSLNFNQKNLSKTLAVKLKKVILFLIDTSQAAYAMVDLLVIMDVSFRIFLKYMI